MLFGYGITQAVPGGTIVSKTGVGAGTTEELDGYFKGIITEIGTGEVGVKFLSHVNAFSTETAQSYNSIYQFSTDSTVAIHSTGQTTSYGSTAVTSAVDWFDQQTLDLTTATVGGLSNVPRTSPRLISFFSIPLKLKPMLSPADADGIS